MATDLERKAKEAFIDDHFELAIELYTGAIELAPNNPELFADRAQANIKLQNFTGAVSDANKAIKLDPSNAKAYLRKGTACLKLEEYQTAKAALEIGASLSPEDSRFTKLIKECDERIAEEAAELPTKLVDVASREVVTPNNVSSNPSSADQTANAVSSSYKPKFRHEFFQKPDEVVVTIFAKGIPSESVVVDFGEQILSVKIESPGEDPYFFQPRLFGKIVPVKCTYKVMTTKIEIRLAKVDNVHWTSLEYSRELPPVVHKTNVPPKGNNKPVYPWPNPKRVDWDKLVAEVKKEEKEEKLDGDAGLNKFFRDIYKEADEDTRRAMSKSFVSGCETIK
ncbi:hypothetical protein M569_13353 [Genlisea aurea]|uniref:Protein SGT1 homolog n=1 Tax=Genlisea aurea TaxID=192259 RepID=S8C467_9LAMI|nr:hypothetical protein M569_13353 [Genlisea aurea]